MARGRMLNKTISLDPEVAELVNELGGLAGVLFTWTISHLDRDGRISGNPAVLHAQVTPLIAGVTPELVRSTLAKAHELGLIVVYESDGKVWVAYPKFEKNQQGMRYDREASGVAPEPSGLTPEWIRSNSDNCRLKGKESKGREEKRREEKETQLSVDLADASPTANGWSDVLAVFDYYRTYHPRAHPKPKSNGKEWRAIKARLEDGYSVSDLRAAIDGCHRSPFHMGENDRGKKYDSLELVMRDSSHVQQFIEIAENGPGKPQGKKHSKFGSALQRAMEWANEDDETGICDANGQAQGLLPERGGG